MSNSQPTIRSGEKIPHLDGTNDHLLYSREFLNKLISVCNVILSNPAWTVTDHGIIQAPAANSLKQSFHPFKLYQPTNISQFTEGILFNDTVGNPVTCNINSTVPTDLSADPPTVNPTTDAWRFWSVRSGEIEYRIRYNLAPGAANPWEEQLGNMPNNNFAWKCPVFTNSDGITGYPVNTYAFPDIYPTGQYDDQTTDTLLKPLIIGSPGGADPMLYTFAFWIQITPDTADALPSFEIRARDCTMLTKQLPDWSPNSVPVGIVSNPGVGIAYIDQIVFDHVSNRYPVACSNFTDSGFGSFLNYRGTFDGAGLFYPADLPNQIFYPGDVMYMPDELYQLGGTVPVKWLNPFAGSTPWIALKTI